MITEAMVEAAALEILRQVRKYEGDGYFVDARVDAARRILAAADAAAWHPWSEAPPIDIGILVEDVTRIGPVVMWCKWADRRALPFDLDRADGVVTISNGGGFWLAENHMPLQNPRRWRPMPIPPAHQEDTDGIRRRTDSLEPAGQPGVQKPTPPA